MSRVAASAFWPDRDHVLLRVRATPKAGKDLVEGLTETAEGPAVKVRVRAVPEDGAANAAVAELVAGWLDLPKSAVAVTAGHKARVKTLTLDGDAGALMDDLARRLAP